MQKSSGLIVISSPNQRVFGEQVCFWLEKPGQLCSSGKQKEWKSCPTEARKKGAASQVEQRMRDEECYGDVEEEAKEGEEEKRKLEVDG